MRFGGAPLTLLLVLAAAPAGAVKDWYAYYEEAKLQVERGRCPEALANLAEARRLKPGSELEQRTYGLDFIDYVPYYFEGRCHLQKGDFTAALRAFEAEEKQGAIQKRKKLYADLLKLKGEARKSLDDAVAQQKAADEAKKARLLLEEFQRLKHDGDELHRQGKLEGALPIFLKAQTAAEGLDPATRSDVLESINKIKAEIAARDEAQARSQRIERELAEGEQLLQAGKGAEAKPKFEDVLGLDPK